MRHSSRRTNARFWVAVAACFCLIPAFLAVVIATGFGASTSLGTWAVAGAVSLKALSRLLAVLAT